MASVVFFTMCLLSLDYVLSTQTTKLLSRYETETTTSQENRRYMQLHSHCFLMWYIPGLVPRPWRRRKQPGIHCSCVHEWQLPGQFSPLTWPRNEVCAELFECARKHTESSLHSSSCSISGRKASQCGQETISVCLQHKVPGNLTSSQQEAIIKCFTSVGSYMLYETRHQGLVLVE